MSTDGMILVNTFEEPFGDLCGKGVWSELSETASSSIQGNIVANASFIGEKRSFACTGLFIEWNGCTTILTSVNLLRNSGFDDKIIENLRIEVLLPNKQRAAGTLQHYNSHYNVALVSVRISVLANQPKFNNGGVPVKLMAARGQQCPWPVELDCKYLVYSTCRITKAGIGGPPLYFDGKFVGMNFYDKGIGSIPYLSWREILSILEYFKTEGTVAEAGDDGNPSRKPDWTKDGDRSV